MPRVKLSTKKSHDSQHKLSTLSTATLRLMTLDIKTLSIRAHRTMILNGITVSITHNDSHHNIKLSHFFIIMLRFTVRSVTMLSVMAPKCLLQFKLVMLIGPPFFI